MLIDIEEDDIMELLENYFTEEVASCPLNAQAFIAVLMKQYALPASMAKNIGKC